MSLPHLRRRHLRRVVPVFAGLCALTACAGIDPYTRPGEWHPLGANAANLTAMVADPHDLAMGQAAPYPPGDVAAAAVARLRADAARHLPASSISSVQVSSGGGGDGGSGGASAAAPVSSGGAASP